jgi:hypothetical protein
VPLPRPPWRVNIRSLSGIAPDKERVSDVISVGEFELNILTQGSGAAAPGGAEGSAKPGPAPMIVASTLEEMRALVNRVAAAAQRLMSIYTPDLEPDLYDQIEFLDIAKRFVLSRSFAKIRVVLGDSSRLLREGNRFVAMGRRLSSYIEIRILQHRVPQRAASYLIADDKAIVLRSRADSWEGVADLGNQAVVRPHLLEFDAVWQANAPDQSLRTASR